MLARGSVAAVVLLILGVMLIVIGFTNRAGVLLAAVLAPTQVEPA